MTDFKEKTLAFISAIPKGKVVSYGQVAAAAGSPRAARQVGGILRALSDEQSKIIPWWRVVNNRGFLSIRGNWTATKELQAYLLKQERVPVDQDFTLIMQQYRWNGIRSKK